MSDMATPIVEEELHAWIDGELPPEREPGVLRYLESQPDVAKRVNAWREQREALRAVFAPVAAEPIPARLNLERLIEQRLDERRTPWRAAAAVLLAFGLGGAGGWFVHGGQPAEPAALTLMAQQAMANHVVYTADLRRPTELGAQQRDDLARWVSNRLKRPVAPPDLSASGYSYMGGRLAATPDGPAGLFMYDDPKGVRITVFVLPLSAAASMPIQQVGTSQVDGFAWIDKGVGYTVVGKLPPEDLRHIAEMVRQQLTGAT